VLVQSLAYLGYVDVDWRKLERDYHGVLDRNHDGKVTVADAELLLKDTQELLKFNMPAGTGFASGFSYGLTGSLRLALGAPLLFGGATTLAMDQSPIELFNSTGLNKGVNAIVDSAAKAGFPITLTREAKLQRLEGQLQQRSIEELRQLEWEVKHEVQVSADLLGLDVSVTDKQDLLNVIENSKKIVKGQK